MFKEVKLITKLHQSTKRNYLQRMNDNKIKCMKVAKKFESQYWDGKSGLVMVDIIYPQDLRIWHR